MKNGFRIVVWDLESSSLDAMSATVLTSTILPLGGKPIVHTNKRLGVDGLDDRKLLCEIRDELNKADIVIGHYHLSFDFPLVQTRLLRYGEKLIEPKLVIDTCRLSRKKLKLPNNRLDTLGKFFNCKVSKTPLLWNDWREAAINGNPKALKKIVEHNVADVKLTAEVFLKMKKLVKSISISN